MSSLTTDQGIVHYETYGEGPPVVLLHGWLESWRLWQETMEQLGRDHRIYALDFWGFGESGKKRETYAVGDFASMVSEFMDRLGIQRAPLVGHSMGGTVSLLLAIKHPRRVDRVAVVGAPIEGSALAMVLKLAGYRPIAFVAYNLPFALRLGLRVASRRITRDRNWYDMIVADLSRTTLESFLLSIASLRKTDLRPRLGEIRMPVMGIYGKKDIIVHPAQWEPLKAGIGHAQIENFADSGHFPMLDEPDRFRRTLREFLAQERMPEEKLIGKEMELPDGTGSDGGGREASAGPEPHEVIGY